MIRAYVLVTASAGKAQHVAEALRGKDGIVLVDAITGEYDVIAQVEVAGCAGDRETDPRADPVRRRRGQDDHVPRGLIRTFRHQLGALDWED